MALRVIVEVEGDDVRLVRAQHVDMPAPGQPVFGVIHDGVYAELRNERDEAIQRHPLSTQLERGVEVFSPDGAARRVDVGPRKQTVMMVLPDASEARSLVFLRASAAARGKGLAPNAAQEPEEIARFPLDTGGDE